MQSYGSPAQRGYAILSDGKLMYWGKDVNHTVSGQHGVPIEHPDLDWPTEKAKDIAWGTAGSQFVVLEDGRIRVIDPHPYDRANIGTAPYVSNGTSGQVLTNVIQVASATYSVYALCSDGSVW